MDHHRDRCCYVIISSLYSGGSSLSCHATTCHAPHLHSCARLSYFPIEKICSRRVRRIGSNYLDLLLVLLGFFIGAYVMLDYEGISSRAGSPNILDSFVSLTAMVLVTEATRRIMGMAMCILIFIALAYAVFGVYLPPMVAHSGYSFERIVNHMFLSTDGILGIPLSVSATVVIVFLIFGAFLEHSGSISSLTRYRLRPIWEI